MRLRFCLLTFVLISWETFCDNENDWIEPNAWSLANHQLALQKKSLINSIDESSCPKCEAVCLPQTPSTPTHNDYIAIFTLYKKFIANLFSRKRLTYVKATNIYRQDILFIVRPEQLEKLEALDDPRDLDVVLTEIFSKAEINTNNESIRALFWDIFKDFWQLLHKSEVQFVLTSAIVICSAWYLNKFYGIGIICMIVCGLVIFGYGFTYLECNKKLKAEEMLNALKNIKDDQEANWWDRIKAIFGSDKQQIEPKILEKAKVHLPYCRPDDVLIIYFNGLFFKHFEVIIEKFITTICLLKEKLPFPYNYAAPIIGMAFFMYIIKLTFKYVISPRAWANFVYFGRSSKHHATPEQLQMGDSAKNSKHIVDDRISGENLKLLLNTISEVANAAITKVDPALMTTVSAVSGVEDVAERTDSSKNEHDHSNEESQIAIVTNNNEKTAIATNTH